MASSYYELLKHPKWQKKRLKALERAEFTCERCGAQDKTLHVHHGYYGKGKKPWEYEDDTLHVLCGECHETEETKRDELYRRLAALAPGESDMVWGYALAKWAAGDPDNRRMRFNNIECYWGACDALGVKKGPEPPPGEWFRCYFHKIEPVSG